MPPDTFIGTDIVDVSRIKELIDSRPRFVHKIFSQVEQDHCNGKADPSIHFAGRFAAKEAIKKALMTSGIKSAISWTDMEIIPDHEGKPIVQLKKIKNIDCKVSISHTKETAIATAIVIK